MAKNNFTDYAGYCDYYTSNDFIAHFGILGMKWGVRRYQNKDGSLTPEGLRRYSYNAETGGYDKTSKEQRKKYKTYSDKTMSILKDNPSDEEKKGYKTPEQREKESVTKRINTPEGKQMLEDGFKPEPSTYSPGDMVRHIEDDKRYEYNNIDIGCRLPNRKNDQKYMQKAKEMIDYYDKNKESILKEGAEKAANTVANDLWSIPDFKQQYGTKENAVKEILKYTTNHIETIFRPSESDEHDEHDMIRIGFAARDWEDMAKSPLGDHIMDIEYDYANKRFRDGISING